LEVRVETVVGLGWWLWWWVDTVVVRQAKKLDV